MPRPRRFLFDSYMHHYVSSKLIWTPRRADRSKRPGYFRHFNERIIGTGFRLYEYISLQSLVILCVIMHIHDVQTA